MEKLDNNNASINKLMENKNENNDSKKQKENENDLKFSECCCNLKQVDYEILKLLKEVPEESKLELVKTLRRLSRNSSDKKGSDTRQLWKKIRNSVNIAKFSLVIRKYGNFSKIRNEKIHKHKLNIATYQKSLINWLILLQSSFIDELKEDPNLNLQFTNYSGELHVQSSSEKIISILSVFLRNILLYASKPCDIPENVQKCLFDHIANNSYFLQRFLSTFEINRLDFNFYGGIKDPSEASMGMLLAFLIFSKTFIHSVLLKILDYFPDLKKCTYIIENTKMIGSIFHYLVMRAFKNKPNPTKKKTNLQNYYRNYHISFKDIGSNDENLANNSTCLDVDEYSAGLIPEDQISCFFQKYLTFCEKFSKFIFQWSVGVAKAIKLKFSE